jgi:hypothetical protein
VIWVWPRSLQPWPTCPSCRLCSTLRVASRMACCRCSFVGVARVSPAVLWLRGGGALLGVMSLCSLEGNVVGPAGASAVAAALVHLPQLQVLKCVASPAGRVVVAV